jgi:uncharacterized iron-regulated membrane protein
MSAPAHPASAPSVRRILGLVHLWIGLILCPPLAIIGLTGSVLVFEHELDDLFGPEPQRASTGPARPIAEIVAAAGTAAPKGFAPLFFVAPEEAGDPAVQPGRGGPGAARAESQVPAPQAGE